MARTIPHRELRNNSSKILAEVQAGETIHITNHGTVVATLIPPAVELPPLRIHPARNPGGWRDFEIPATAPEGAESWQDILDDLRGDR